VGFVKFRFELIDAADTIISEMVPTIMFGLRAPEAAA
jgi:hypothetical protein